MTVVNGASIMGGKTLTGTQTYTVVIDPDTALEEIVDVTLYSSGNTLTITRGVDGPTPGTGSAHSAGAVVRHMAIGRDYQEANDHIEGTLAGHAATTSAELRGVISDETGTGSLVFGTSPTITSATLVTPALGTPASGTLTNATGLPISTGVSGLGTGVATFLGTPSSANLRSALTDETGTGAAVFGTSPTIATPTITSPTITGTGTIAGTFTGNLTGNVTGTVSGNAGTVTNGVYTTDTGTVTSTMIANDTIVNADINSSAQVAYGKLALTNSVVNADINASAAIEWTKIAPSSTVSATELGYLDGVTSAVQTQIDSKLATSTASSTYAPLASPALTGTPTAPTATAGTNTTQVATTAFVKTAVDNIVDAAPGALDTLNELAAAMGDDPNFATTVTNNLATKLPLAGGTMSGAIAMGGSKITGLGTPTNNTDAATKLYADTILVGAPGNLTGPITSVGALTSVAAQTGTGSTFVMQNTPTLTTPVLGVATATSINGTTIPSSKTLVATDSTTYVVPSQTGNSGKYLTTDGTTSSWGTVAGYSAPTLGSTSIASGATVSNVNALTINSTTIPTSKTLVDTDSSQTLTNKTLTSSIENNPILKSPEERYTVSATAATGTINYDAQTQGVLYYTTNASGNWTLNIRGASGVTLDSILAVGDSITVAFLVTNGATPYYQTTFQIDGNLVSVRWSGGTAPSAGNASGIDAYSFTIIKTAATPLYTVLGVGPVKYA
jgi:hypothetical protein